MSIERWAENIKELAESDVASQSRDKIIAANADAILGMLKWTPISERISDDEALVKVKLADGTVTESWYCSMFGWECCENQKDNPVIAWRKLV